MDLLNVLIDPKYAADVCFLCFKVCSKTSSLHEFIYIRDNYLDMNLTIFQVMNILFPTHEILLKQVCENCTNVILKMFCLMQKNYFRKEMLNHIINNLNEQIDVKPVDKGKYRIKLDLPTAHTIMDNDQDIITSNCTKCDMKFDSKPLLKNHMKITHRNTNQASFCDTSVQKFEPNKEGKDQAKCRIVKSCPICGKILKRNSYYKVHLRNHITPQKRDSKTFFCDMCDYKTVSKGTLEAHINKLHLKIRPYTCSICPKAFYKKSNLTEHVQLHERTEEQICEICGQNIFTKKKFDYHIKSHNQDKKFKCDYCELSFITQGHRLEHKKRKHMEKTECCKVCSKKFSLAKDLKVHLKKIHNVYGQFSHLKDKPKMKVLT